jgi:mono/diheme cytochrome c family protein
MRALRVTATAAAVVIASASAVLVRLDPAVAVGPPGVRDVHGPWTAPETEARRPNPIRATIASNERSVAVGRRIYERRCAPCHGLGGRGDGPRARALPVPPAELASETVARQSDGALFWKISTGRRPMTSYRRELTEEERWSVVNYIRRLTWGARP